LHLSQRKLAFIPQIPGFDIGSLCISILAHDTEGNAFLMPDHGIVGIEPDRLIKTFCGFTILANAIETEASESSALAKESNAFVNPGQGRVGIKPDGFIKTFHGLIVLVLAIETDVRVIES